MNQLLVPQFIDVEPKIIGPISVRQFLIMVVALMIGFIEYKLLDFWAFVTAVILTVGVGVILAFAKINGRPFHYFILNVIETLKRPKLRLWNKNLNDQEIKELILSGPEETLPEIIAHKGPLSHSHLEELALVVNTGGAYEAME